MEFDFASPFDLALSLLVNPDYRIGCSLHANSNPLLTESEEKISETKTWEAGGTPSARQLLLLVCAENVNSTELHNHFLNIYWV